VEENVKGKVIPVFN